MEIALALVAAVTVIMTVYILVFIRPRTSEMRGFREEKKELFTDYAHRGLHGGNVPENSLAAFKKAIELGHGIELDIQLSRDGKVMVFHDYSLERMTGCGRRLCELDAAELRELRLGGGEEKIPYLTEVLELVDGRVPLLIELKGESTDTSLCPAAREILRGYSGKYCVESFNPMLLRWYKKHDNEVMRGILVTNVMKDKKKSVINFCLTHLLTNILCRPDFVAYNIVYSNFAVDVCTNFFAAPSFAWTVRDENEYYTARERGSYVIFENIKPDR